MTTPRPHAHTRAQTRLSRRGVCAAFVAACIACAVTAVPAVAQPAPSPVAPASAPPPAQADLPRGDLLRMPREEREALEKRLGASIATIVPPAADNPGFGLADLRGDPIVIQAWNARRGASRKNLQTVADALAAQRVPVALVALHVGESRGDTDPGLNVPGLTFRAVADENGGIALALALREGVGNLIADKAGVVRYAGVRAEAVPALVAALAAEESPTPAETDIAAIAAAAAPAAGADVSGLLRDAGEAIASGRGAQAEALLIQAVRANAARGVAAAADLAIARDRSHRPIGVSVLMQHADGPAVLRVIDAMHPGRNGDSRRFLVRSLGRKDLPDKVRVLGALTRDSDREVQIAAVYALADHRDAAAMEFLLPIMDRPPLEIPSWDGDEQERLDMAVFGTARVITGLRSGQRKDFEAWFDLYRRDPAAAQRAAAESARAVGTLSPPVQRYGETWTQLADVDVAVRAASPMPLDFNALSADFARSIAAAQRASEPFFGVVHLPPYRVYVTDKGRFTSTAGGNSDYPGASRGNELTLRGDTEAGSSLAQIMYHEHLNVMQAALFEDQPRWLLEGFASSLQNSPEGTVWTPATLQEAGIADALNTPGLFSSAMSWESASSTGQQEARQYATAHAAVDVLRFGGFGAEPVRLAFLMNAISRGEGDPQALEAVYGLRIADLDRRAAQVLLRVAP